MSKDLSSKPPKKQTRDEQLRGRVVRTSNAYLLVAAIVLLFITTQIFVAVVVGLILLATGTSQDGLNDAFSNPYILLAFGALVDAVLIGSIYGAYRLFKLRLFKDIGLLKMLTRRQALETLGIYALYFVSFGLVWVFVSRFVPSIDTEQTQSLGFESLQGLEYAATVTALIILPPITEEILFRGVLYQRLKYFVSIKTSLILTSVVFGAAHLELLGDGPPNWIAALDTFIFSLFLIFAYERTKSLWAPVIIHALKNSVAFVAVFIL